MLGYATRHRDRRVLLAAALVVTLSAAAALSSVVVHTADPGYAYVPGLEPYLPAGINTWQVPDFSAYMPGYAFAQVQDSTAFITTWQTTSAGQTIKIPVEVHSGGTLTIDWGDGGTADTVTTNGVQSHEYDTAGSYRVTMTGDLSRINLGGSGSTPASLHSINQWGDIPWSTMKNAFRGAEAMTYNATDTPDLSQVTDMSFMFSYTDAFNGDLSSWNTSLVTDMSGMFSSANAFNGDLSSWNTSSVTIMSHMFYSADTFNGDLSSWNTSSVTDMPSMFELASTFNGDLSGWNTSSVTDMYSMFAGANAFNGDLSGWNTSSVTDMYSMFSDAHAFNGDISGWNTSSVTTMTAMFFAADKFNRDLSSWNTSSVTDMSFMFFAADAFNGDISGWDVSSVTYMDDMFIDAGAFDQNLGPWYITPDSVDFSYTVSLNVTDITPQNDVLAGHNPVYNIGAGGNSDLFEIVSGSDTLAFKATPPSNGLHNVNVIATGDSVFENGNNHRMVQVTVSGILTDSTPPRVTSILRNIPLAESTTATTLVFAVTFDEPVTNVDAADFAVTGTGTGSISNVSGSGASYTVTVTVTAVGTIGLDIASNHDIKDTADNGLTDLAPTDNDEIYTVTVVDDTPPHVASILRNIPLAESTTATTLVFAVTFDEPVINVDDTADFAVTGTGTGSISNVSGDDASYRVTVTVTASGTIGLDISPNHDIKDTANNDLTDLTVVGSNEAYTVNQLPVLNNIPSQTGDELTPLTFTAEATDRDNHPLTYSLIGTIPDGATMDANTGVFSWEPTETQDGTHTVTVQVSDGNGGSDSETVTITVREVNVDPVLTPTGPQNVDELDPLTFTATAADEDSVGGTDNTLTFSLTDNPPRGAAITPGGVFTWTPDQSQDGDHIVTVQVSDGSGGTDSETVSVTVNDIEPMPVSARSTGSSITLTLSEIVTSSGTGPNGFSVQHDGEPVSVDSITGSGTKSLVLELSGSISAPAKISYDGSGDVTDEDNKALAAFSDLDVSFPSTRSGSTSSSPSVDTLEINGQSYNAQNRVNHNAAPLDVVVDQPISMNFPIHDRLDILYFAVYLNLQDDDMSYTNSDTYVEYNRGQTNIVDPQNLLSDASLTVSTDPDDSTEKTVTLDITFAEAIGNTNMVVRTWNADQKSSIIIITDVLNVIHLEVDPEPQVTTETDPESQLPTVPNPEPGTETFADDFDYDRALLVLRMWSGFESEIADDNQLLAVMGLTHMGTDIPAWVMTDLAPLVVKELITLDEFRVALEYVMRNT